MSTKEAAVYGYSWKHLPEEEKVRGLQQHDWENCSQSLLLYESQYTGKDLALKVFHIDSALFKPARLWNESKCWKKRTLTDWESVFLCQLSLEVFISLTGAVAEEVFRSLTLAEEQPKKEKLCLNNPRRNVKNMYCSTKETNYSLNSKDIIIIILHVEKYSQLGPGNYKVKTQSLIVHYSNSKLAPSLIIIKRMIVTELIC